ncbi:hypothetical protein QCA50_007551 [Cerrena zonata]|uniref:Uncharacterized protein n=1 Tax=Cerrena zonata TaxID=2478898 RepID=A0AAW0GBB9_9APHY
MDTKVRSDVTGWCSGEQTSDGEQGTLLAKCCASNLLAKSTPREVYAAELFIIVGGLWIWDLRAAYGVQSFNISTIREWFLYRVAPSGFVFSFLFVTIIVSRLFEMRVDKPSEEQDKYPLTSYALDRCSLQFGEVPVSNTHRILSYLSGMLRLPSLLWTLATFCVYLFDSKLNDSLGVLVLRVACSVAEALVSPVILVEGLRKLGNADFEAERVELVEREMKKGVEGEKGF